MPQKGTNKNLCQQNKTKKQTKQPFIYERKREVNEAPFVPVERMSLLTESDWWEK